MKEPFERLSTGALAGAALVIAALMVRRELFPRETVSRPVPTATAPSRVERWGDLLKLGRRVGKESSPVTIVEFADLECPFCASFHKTFRAVKREYGDSISLVFLHFPLPFHRFAGPAARAAECAATAGHFERFLDEVFQHQDSLGLKTWSGYASAAGITDTSQFRRCATDTVALRAVEEAIALGKEIGVHGTPTVLINGWLFAVPPSEAEVKRAIKAMLAGKDPA